MRYALHDNSVSSSAKQQREPISIAFEVSLTTEHLTSHFWNHSSIISSHFVFKMFTILDLNWNERLGDGKRKWEFVVKYCSRHPYNRPQHRSFHENDCKVYKNKKAPAKRAKLLVLPLKYANMWRSCRRRHCSGSLLELERDSIIHPFFVPFSARSTFPLGNLKRQIVNLCTRSWMQLVPSVFMPKMICLIQHDLQMNSLREK